jgi:hypothetical protein
MKLKLGSGETWGCLLQSRALANTNHQAMKLWCRLNGCDSPLASCYLRVICPSHQVSIMLQLPGLGGSPVPVTKRSN